jgi:hypothetical protein
MESDHIQKVAEKLAVEDEYTPTLSERADEIWRSLSALESILYSFGGKAEDFIQILDGVQKEFDQIKNSVSPDLLKQWEELYTPFRQAMELLQFGSHDRFKEFQKTLIEKTRHL